MMHHYVFFLVFCLFPQCLQMCLCVAKMYFINWRNKINILKHCHNFNVFFFILIYFKLLIYAVFKHDYYYYYNYNYYSLDLFLGLSPRNLFLAEGFHQMFVLIFILWLVKQEHLPLLSRFRLLIIPDTSLASLSAWPRLPSPLIRPRDDITSSGERD